MNQTPYTCLVVEDEPLAQEIMVDYIREVPFLTLAGVASNAFEASELLRQTSPDLILLDINLPRLGGLEWLRLLESKPRSVIITTANPSFALEGYELDVIDYLLKPIRLERFIKAVTRFEERSRSLAGPLAPADVAPTTHFFVKVNKGLTRVAFEEVLFVKGLDDYIQIFVNATSLVTNMRMQEIEEILPRPLFFRLNRSFIVHRQSVAKISGTQVTLSTGVNIGVTVKYKDNLQALVKALNSTR